jgi:hypothetical protein
MKNIHVIPTSNPSKIFYIAENFHLEKGQLIEPKSYHNVYITSDDYPLDGEISMVAGNHLNKFNSKFTSMKEVEAQWRKIILTTDQDLIADGVQSIDDEFLEWFINNPSCEEIEVVDNLKYFNVDELRERHIKKLPYLYSEKIGYKIIIPQEEPKQEKDLAYWKENAEEDYMKVPISVLRYITELEERMYSEEKVREAFKHGILFKEESVSTCEEAIEAEFSMLVEQFKKK